MNALGVIVVQGLTFGSIYAVSALGFGLVYNTTRAFHIAFGSIGLVGAYVVVALSPRGSLWQLLLALAAGAVVAAALTAGAFGLYSLVNRRRDGQLAVFVVSLGISFALEPLIVLTRGADPVPFGRPDLLAQHAVLGMRVSYLAVGSVVGGLLLLGLVKWLFGRTRWGFQVKGLAANPELAALVGVKARGVLLGVLALAGTFGTIAAVMLGMLTQVTPTGGTAVTLVAAVAVIAGGVGSYTGAYLFGLVFGLLQAVMATLLPGGWVTVGVYAAILLLILLRPTGLGRGILTKAV
jgi:branched-chain amino acid transport system permease protein